MSYKTELHCHTSEFSRCSGQSGVDKAEMYIENGYSTVVVTNHFCAYYPEHKEYETFTRRFFEAADVMREAAKGRLNVLTGMELTFKESGNDYLVYGMTEDMLLEIPEIFDMGLQGFFHWTRERGVLVIQAHPLRFRIATREPWYLDGIEVYNASHDNFCNKAADLWADLCDREFYDGEPKFIRTSGSDHHSAGQWANAGIVTESPIKTMDELVNVLRGGEYELLRG
ncbi:MAG: hypothetical protein IJ386_03770 [Clostridia bacterium]|nr:hypothetical protein [Clostridia bacterium]